jgi:adenylate cyclase
MGKEIERKFLLKNDFWRSGVSGEEYVQGYLTAEKGKVVRVRIAGNQGYLTIKGRYVGYSRPEFEYEISPKDARFILDNLCLKPLIEKIRYKIKYKNFTWEIDEFKGDNKGLILAEIELQSENQHFEIPEWIGEEVSGDPRYFNSNLVKHPFTKW